MPIRAQIAGLLFVFAFAACSRPSVVADHGPADATITVASVAPTAAPPAPAESLAGASSDAPPESTAVGDCGLRATLVLAPSNFGAFKLTLTNTSKRTLRLVEPGDGSSTARRTPMVAWSATLAGRPAPPDAVGYCGNTNPMEAGEVFALAPGKSRTFDKWLDEPHVKPGTYDVRVRYRNDPRVTRNASPDVVALVASTDACEVTSNAIKATFPAR